MESKYLSAEALAPRVAQFLKEQMTLVLKESPVLSLGLSGGKSPTSLFHELAKILPAELVRRLVVFLVDERHVPFSSPDSNYKLVKENFIDHLIVSPKKFIHPLTFLSQEEAAQQYEKDLKEYDPLDLLVLGLGEDGHTASLFPGEEYLAKDGKMIVAPPLPHLGHKRITLNYKTILDAHLVIFYVPGKNKKEILEKVCQNGDNFPAQRIILRHPKVIVFKEKT